MSDRDLSDFSMLDLFRMEVESQATLLDDNLLALENSTSNSADRAKLLESLMRAAHSIKGAARIVKIEPAVKVAHVMEDCFVATQNQAVDLTSDRIDLLLQGVDLLKRIAEVADTYPEEWDDSQQAELDKCVAAIAAILEQAPPPKQQLEEANPNPPVEPSSTPVAESPTLPKSQGGQDRGVRVSRANLNRLMGLAGESLIEANWVLPFADSLQKLRWRQGELSKAIEALLVQTSQPEFTGNEVHNPVNFQAQLEVIRHSANHCFQILSEHLGELEGYARRSANLSDRLYREVISTQMRPFADGVENFPRMMRDLIKQLGKQVKFEIFGKSTQVDRDILERLEVPLIHLLRNAVDHGIEMPEERLQAGKPAEGTIRVEAVHQAGMLWITIADDGRGVDLESLRQTAIAKGLVSAEMGAQLTEAELMDFLFLPGFSTSNTVTEISGRGVGLDIVRSIVQEVGGVLRATSQIGQGMTFQLQLPLTLSVVRTLLVEIGTEAYAFALARIDQVLRLPKQEVFRIENRQFFALDGENIGLVAAHRVLECREVGPKNSSDHLSVIVISDRASRYGVIVDRFLGAKDLVVRPLDPRLGKVQDISAAALLEDGSIVLIVDVEDLVRSIDKLLAGEHFTPIEETDAAPEEKQFLKILVVDDSITVREVERKLLENRGYKVQVAVNGMDAWNAIRTEPFDLVITDVDMPRMNGIELVSQIRQNPKLKSLPAIVVSYKDREEDYIKGLDVGANYYLTKSSFQDDTLLKAVVDLIGEA